MAILLTYCGLGAVAFVLAPVLVYLSVLSGTLAHYRGRQLFLNNPLEAEKTNGTHPT